MISNNEIRKSDCLLNEVAEQIIPSKNDQRSDYQRQIISNQKNIQTGKSDLIIPKQTRNNKPPKEPPGIKGDPKESQN